ncbi:MAG: tetratricopeptide repeat protein [Thermoplasmatota archaeon]
MKEAMESLESMDPSDSMEGIMSKISALIEIVREDPLGDGSNKALSLIFNKEKKTREYYMRPFDSDSIYNSLIEIHALREESEMAELYRRCLDLRQARKWTIIGDSYALMGINARAVKFLKRALFFGPSEDLVDEVQRTYDKALKRVEKADDEVDVVLVKIQKDPGNLKNVVKAVSLLIDLDRLDEANKICTEALSSFPDEFDLVYRKGCIEFALDDFTGAESTFQKALEMNPNSTNAKRAVNFTEEMLKGNL